MLFGDVKLFAIECRLSHNPENEWMMGYVNYYINNNKIGDIGFTTTLRDVMIQLQGLCMYPERRVYKKLFNKEYNEIFLLISNAIQEEICAGNDKIFGDTYGSYPGEFIISLEVDVMDDWPIYMVSSGAFDKLICKDEENNLFYCGTFDRGVVDNVMMDTLLYLEEIHRNMIK